MTPSEEQDYHNRTSIVVLDGGLRDERQVQIRETGLIVTHRITPTASARIQFQIIDPLPGQIGVQDPGFHPDHEPLYGRVTDNYAILGGVVDPGDDLVVKYGLRTERPPRPETISELQASITPSIEVADEVDRALNEKPGLETASMTRSTGTVRGDGPEPGSFFGWLRRSLQSDDRASETGQPAGSEGPKVSSAPADRDEPSREEHRADGTRVDEESGPTKATEGSVGPSFWRDGPENQPTGTAEAAPNPPASGRQATDQVSEVFSATETDSTQQAPSRGEPPDGTPAAGPDGGGRGKGASGDDGEIERARPRGTVVEAFLAELDSGELTADQRRRLVELLASGESHRRSTEVRIRSLEADIQTFEAYADALAAIIDEHGPAEEFLASVRDDIATMGRAVESLRRDLDREREARKALEARLRDVTDEMAVLDSRFDRISDQVEWVRTHHQSAVSKLEADLDALKPTADRVDALTTQVESLRSVVEDVEARHQAIARALTDDEGGVE